MTIIGVNEGATLDAGNLSGILYNYGNLTLKNINFINGNGSEYHGGAIYSQGHLTVTDCTFTSNYAYNGGVIYNEGTLIVNGCTYSKNNADLTGSAIFNRFGNLTITNSNFKDNKYESSLIDCYSSFVTVNNITLEDNKFTGYNRWLVFSKCNSNIRNCNFTIPISISGDGCLTECSFENTRLDLYMNIDNNTFKNCEIGFYNDNIIFSNNLLDNTSLKIFSINTTVKNSIFKNYNDYPIHAFNNLTNINGCTFENSTGAIKLENYNNYKMDLNIINSTFNNISKTAIDMEIYSNKQNNSIFIDNCKINKCKDGIILNGNNVTILNCEFLNIKNTAIYAYGDNPHINNCSFENTKTGINLEGKYNFHQGYISAKNIEIANSKFKNNEYAISVFAKKLTVINCSIDSNKKIGIRNYDLSSTIINCTVANSCAAIELNNYDTPDSINIIDNCKFINNTDVNVDGAIITLNICKQTQISNSIFINNTVRQGTANSYQPSSRLIVNNSKFINNTALEKGGGIYTAGPTNIVNCLFKQNKAEIGSSISFILDDGDSLVENCTFIDNIAKNWDVSGYSDMNVTQTEYYYGDIVLKVNYTDKLTNKPIYNAPIWGFIPQGDESLFTNHKEYHILTDSTFKTSKDGSLTIKMASLKVGTHRFCVWDDESAKYKEIKITVKKAPTKLVASKLTKAYDPNDYYTVKLLNSKTKKGIGYIKVTITVSGKKITTTTDKNGNAKFSMSKFALGLNKLQIKVSDSNVNSAKTTSTLKLNKAKTIITAPKLTAKYKKSAYFKVTVKTASKKLVKNTKVKVKIGSKTYNVKTNSKGVAQVNTKSLKIGTHKVSISSGDSRLTMSKKSTIVIKK